MLIKYDKTNNLFYLSIFLFEENFLIKKESFPMIITIFIFFKYFIYKNKNKKLI
jgi:hypothetical protein